jgi:hypothetical protein
MVVGSPVEGEAVREKMAVEVHERIDVGNSVAGVRLPVLMRVGRDD